MFNILSNKKQEKARRSIIAAQFDIKSGRNYGRISNGDVLSGRQVLDLLEIANPFQQSIILLDIYETTEEVTVTSF